MVTPGSWKKERAKGRKYSGGDEHKAPPARSRKQFWVAAHTRRGGIKVRGHMRKNAAYGRQIHSHNQLLILNSPLCQKFSE